MSFNITICNNSSDPKYLNKTITDIATVNINPNGSIDIINPIFIIDYNVNFINANYCKANFLGRNYFIDDIAIAPGKTMALSCTIDVLTTYKDQILNSIGLITRSESIGKPTYVVDDKLPIETNKVEITSIPFDSESFTIDSYQPFILHVINGPTSETTTPPTEPTA